MKKLKRNMDDAMTQLLTNFEAEFGARRISHEPWVDHSKPIPGLEDEEVSSFHSMFEQVCVAASCYRFPVVVLLSKRNLGLAKENKIQL
jgi:hypothetical protein